MTKTILLLSTLLSFILVIPGCTKPKDGSTLSNQNTSATTTTDNFSFIGNDFSKESGHAYYTWKCTKTNIQVNTSVLKNGGDGTIVLQDPSGKKVFNKKISELSASTNLTGMKTGDYSVQINFSLYDGKLTLALQAY